MLNSLNNVVNFLNSYIWGVGMLILIVGSGVYFTIRLHGFQFVHFKDMWSRIIDKQDSDTYTYPFFTIPLITAAKL